MQRTEIESCGTARRIAAALVIGICLAGAPLAGDVPGSLQGSVIGVDTDGARTVVPGAKVTLVGERNDGVDSQRITVRDLFIEPQQTAVNRGVLWLSNDGRSRYREFQATVRYQIRRDVVNASYVHSSAIGDLNDFNQIFGKTPNLIIRPNERSGLSFDTSNRFLVWGELSAPWKITPPFEVHTGFPYSIVNEERDFVGHRNRAGRFLRFASTDLQETKRLPIPFFHKKHRAQAGLRVFNLFYHYSPRDLEANLVCYPSGEFFHSVDRMIRGKSVVEF